MHHIHGFHNVCGIPGALTRALRARGERAQCIAWNASRHAHAGVDWCLYLSGLPTGEKRRRRARVREFVLAVRPDWLHLHFNDSTDSVTVMEAERSNTRREVRRADAAMRDLDAFTARGIRLTATFHGCDVRRRGGDPVCAHCTYQAPCAIEDQTRAQRLSRLRERCEALFVTTPDLLDWVPGAVVTPQAVPLAELRAYAAAGRHERRERRAKTRPLRVVHAPSSPDKKGTAIVKAAVDRLRAQGASLEFRLVTGITHRAFLAAIAGADLLIEQLHLGWYGVTAVEALALGVPVLTYLRPDLPDVPGIWRTSAATLAVELAELLDLLRRDPQAGARQAEAGRAWVERTHDPAAVLARIDTALGIATPNAPNTPNTRRLNRPARPQRHNAFRLPRVPR